MPDEDDFNNISLRLCLAKQCSVVIVEASLNKFHEVTLMMEQARCHNQIHVVGDLINLDDPFDNRVRYVTR